MGDFSHDIAESLCGGDDFKALLISGLTVNQGDQVNEGLGKNGKGSSGLNGLG